MKRCSALPCALLAAVLIAPLGGLPHSCAEESRKAVAFVGIGVQVKRDPTDGLVRVVQVLPAASNEVKTAFKRGDIILRVEGKKTRGMSVGRVTELIRGPVGSSVKLTIQHPDSKHSVEFTIVRRPFRTE